MKQLAADSPDIAQRLDLFEHGETEQFFDYENDPDALHNLIDDPQYQDDINALRAELEAWMVRTNDHALTAFRNRTDRSVLDTYVDTMQAESDARRKPQQPRQRPRQQTSLIQFDTSSAIDSDQQTVQAVINYKLPGRLNEQKLHVTLKNSAEQRLQRKVIAISQTGTTTVSFELPRDYSGKSVFLAAFVGEDFQTSLQHITTKVASGK
jgi:hypothetical protein